MKKSQVSSQFNWIFVLIVGGMFLVMFFTMSTRQSTAADTRISAIALSGISTIFESARTGTSLSSVVNVPNIEIRFTCETGLFNSDNIYSDYRVGTLSRRIPALPTFAPGTLSGDDLVTWTVSWDMPFKVMNFLFLANSMTRFFLYFPEDEFPELKRAINNSFSSNIRHMFIDSLDEIADYNDDHSIIVVFTSDDSNDFVDEMDISLEDIFEKDARILQVVPDSNYLFGYVDYYDKRKSHQSRTTYFGLASLYGAMFSPSSDFYECSMLKAMKRFQRVSCVYKQKYSAMRETYERPACMVPYDAALNTIDLYFGTDFCMSDNGDASLGNPNEVVFDEFDSEKLFFESLTQHNRQTISGSCELLY